MSLQIVVQAKAESVLVSEASFYGVTPTALAKAIIDKVATGGMLRDVLQGVDVNSYQYRRPGRPKSVFFEYKGKKLTLNDISKLTGVPYPTLRARVCLNKWTIDRAVTQPIKGRAQ